MRDKFGISERLRILRGDQSQTEFSSKVGVPLRTYLRYEKGDRIPPDGVLEKIATACNKPVAWLAQGTFGMWDYFDDLKKNKKTNDVEIDDTLVIGILKYLKTFPKEFDRIFRIMEEGNWDKIDAVKSLLRALDPIRSKKVGR